MDAERHLRTFIKDQHKEHFIVMFLSGANKHITTEVLFEGSITSSAVYPRELLKRILELGAVSLILAHNHPSGNPNPSVEDKQITQRIKEMCKLIDVQVHDHLVLANEQCTSFTDL